MTREGNERLRRWIQTTCARLALAAAVLAPLAAHAGTVHGPIARLRAEGRYDQNLVDDSSDAAGLLQPMLGWRAVNPTTEIEATYTADLIGYGKGGAGRGGVNHRVRGFESFQLDRQTVLQLRQGAEHVYDPTALSRPGVVRAAGTSLYADAQGDLQKQFSPRWTAGVRYRFEMATLEVESASDGAVHAPGTWALWAWTRRDFVGAGYRMQYFDTFEGGTDATSHEPSLRYVRLLERTTRLELEAGPAVYAMGGDTSLFPRLRAGISHDRPRLTLAGWFERGLVGSTGFEGALWTDTLGGSAVWRLAEPFRVGAVAAVFRNGRAPDERSFVEGFAGELSLEYDLGAGLVAETAWRRVAQVNLVGNEAIDLSRNIFAVGLTWNFQDGRLPR